MANITALRIGGTDYSIKDTIANQAADAVKETITFSGDKEDFLVANWKAGYYQPGTGNYDTWSKAICTSDALTFYSEGIFAIAPEDYGIQITEFDENGDYVTEYGIFNPATGTPTHYVGMKVNKGSTYQITVGLFNSGEALSKLTQTFINKILVYHEPATNEAQYTNRIFQYVENWKTGYYKDADGTYDTWTRALCTINPYVATESGDLRVVAPNDAHVLVTEYNSEGTYIGSYGGFNDNSGIVYRTLTLGVTKGYGYHITLGLWASGGGTSRCTQEYLNKLYVYTSYNEKRKYDIESDGTTANRTAEIQAFINQNGSCKLGPGLFCVDGIIMPDNSTIEGCGAKTELRLLPSSNTNLWTFGNEAFVREVILTFNETLPAGIYKFTADIVSDDTETSVNGLNLYTGEPYIPAQTGAGKGQISRGTGNSRTLIATKPFTAIGLYAAVNYASSEGKTATFSNVSFVRLPTAIILGSNNTVKNLLISGSEEEITVPSTYGNRNGIGYYGEGTKSTIKRGVIDGCFIRSFTGGGIDLNNTGFGSQGLNVCNCYIWNCYCGFHAVHFTEFHRVTGCCFNYNHIGIVNNGGNNQFTGCSCTGNVYGMVMDNSSGEHNNGTHGGCVGCIFQHNSEKTIYINTEVSGFMFSACNIDPDEDGQTGIEIVDSTRIIFDACNFMAYFKAVITNGGMVLFNACNFRTTLDNRIFITNNNAVRFNACYTSNGTEVNPVSN